MPAEETPKSIWTIRPKTGKTCLTEEVIVEAGLHVLEEEHSPEQVTEATAHLKVCPDCRLELKALVGALNEVFGPRKADA